MSVNVGGAAGQRRTQGVGGRFVGRFVYTARTLEGAQTDRPVTHNYVCHRSSDNRYLGEVRRRAGSSWWYAWPRDAVEPLLPRQRRREWVADQLDAQSLLHTWCACGVAVGAHDRPTRAACRAWARWEYDPNGPDRRGAAWQDAWAGRPRGRHYDVDTCVDHAEQYVKGLTPGHAWLVEPDVAPSHNAWVRHDDREGCVVITQVVGGRFGDTTAYPAEYTLETVGDLVLARGLAPVHDWSR